MANLKVTVTLSDGVVHTPIEVINPDRVRWDITAHKHKFPSFSEAPFLGTTFLAWAALRRLSLYSENFETFRDYDCHVVDIIEGEDVEDDDNIGTPM